MAQNKQASCLDSWEGALIPGRSSRFITACGNNLVRILTLFLPCLSGLGSCCTIHREIQNGTYSRIQAAFSNCVFIRITAKEFSHNPRIWRSLMDFLVVRHIRRAWAQHSTGVLKEQELPMLCRTHLFSNTLCLDPWQQCSPWPKSLVLVAMVWAVLTVLGLCRLLSWQYKQSTYSSSSFF